MKRKVMSLFLLVCIVFSLSFVLSDNHTINDSTGTSVELVEETDLSGFDKAYECLEEEIDGKCSSLSLEEKIFSVLAIDQCTDELNEERSSDNCWPKSSCNVKQTAQSLLAFDNQGRSTDGIESWLSSKNVTPQELTWYLQIEASEQESTCQVSYSGASHTVKINEDKTLSSSAGSCLTLSEDKYWLRVSPSCYGIEFETKCDEGFLTTLLYKKKTSSTIYVAENSHSASAEATTLEKVNSKCFGVGNSCDYEGSLWAALALESLDLDISAYLPYLITLADENQELIPESFLYMVTNYDDYRNDILLSQQNSQYWNLGGNKFYDTAVALLPFPGTPSEKQGSIDWLLEVQDESGCFNNNNKRDTAFLLYSLFPKDSPNIDDDLDCVDAGNYCRSRVSCGESNVLSGYSCAGAFKCCSEPNPTNTCASLSGDVCNSRETCEGGEAGLGVSGLEYGQSCCVGGRCEESITPIATCESDGGYCKTSSCSDDEQEISYSTCPFEADYCCEEKPNTSVDTNYLWLWIILILLIILLVVAIIFRDRLKPYWYKMTSKKKQGPGPGNRPYFGGPPATPMSQQRRSSMRQIPRGLTRPSVPMRRPMQRPRPIQRPRGELNNVLGKLKDMSK